MSTGSTLQHCVICGQVKKLVICEAEYYCLLNYLSTYLGNMLHTYLGIMIGMETLEEYLGSYLLEYLGRVGSSESVIDGSHDDVEKKIL